MIGNRENLTPQEKGVETHALDSIIIARYIKYEEVKGFPYPGLDHVSGDLHEIESYGIDKNKVTSIVDNANFIIKQREKYGKQDHYMPKLGNNLKEINSIDYTAYSFDQFGNLAVVIVRNTNLFEKQLLLEIIVEWKKINQSKLTGDPISQLNHNIRIPRNLMQRIGIDRETWEKGFYKIKITKDIDNPKDSNSSSKGNENISGLVAHLVIQSI